MSTTLCTSHYEHHIYIHSRVECYLGLSLRSTKKKAARFFSLVCLGLGSPKFFFFFCLIFFKFLVPTLLFTRCHVILCASSCCGCVCCFVVVSIILIIVSQPLWWHNILIIIVSQPLWWHNTICSLSCMCGFRECTMWELYMSSSLNIKEIL